MNADETQLRMVCLQMALSALSDEHSSVEDSDMKKIVPTAEMFLSFLKNDKKGAH